ncbi:MAG: glycosyltransferase family 4 protein [Verrucomicrobiota bacterium]
MKILILTGDAKTLIYHRGELIKSFAAQGLKVVAAASQDLDYVSKFMMAQGGHYRTVNLDRTSLNPLHDIKAILSIQRLIRQEKPDIIFSYAIKSVIYGSILAKLNGVAHRYALVPGLGYAFTPDGTWKQRFVCWASTALYSLALRCVDKVFLQNHDDDKLLRERNILPTRIPSHVTLGSGVKLDEFQYQQRDFQSGPLRCVLVTRLLRKKGVVEFAEASRLLKDRECDIQFDLVGPLDSSPDGIPAEQVRNWEEEGLLTYHGETRDVASFLNQAHIFVLPTYYREGVPRSILEALSSGLAIVTTDAVGSRETVRLTKSGRIEKENGADVIQGENGFLVRPHSADAVAQVLQLMNGNRARVAELGRASRMLAEQQFDVRRVNAGILNQMGFEAPNLFVVPETTPEVEESAEAA